MPPVLLSGNHADISRWRLKQALGRTWQRRPDLLEKRVLSDDERKLLEEFKTGNEQAGIEWSMTMDLIQKLETEEIARLGKNIPDFKPGDTVVVNVNVVEGDRKRVQAYEGVVIAKKSRGLNSAFIVRKISSGEGVERTFQTVFAADRVDRS